MPFGTCYGLRNIAARPNEGLDLNVVGDGGCDDIEVASRSLGWGAGFETGRPQAGQVSDQRVVGEYEGHQLQWRTVRPAQLDGGREGLRRIGGGGVGTKATT